MGVRILNEFYGKNKASRPMNPGSAGILPALLSRMSHPLEFIISWTTKNAAMSNV